ncbi:hypothetical protein MRB53_009444 [Persea americana]|uniref:Uncharacterized protein n=1 Tax=Persea americana TaxID=3435 RepID=A0ACC2LQ21_PERAE|nr:hypothetical protein MRB53_009444 [Persea americana]
MSSHIWKDKHDIQPSVQHSPLGQKLASTSDTMMDNSRRKCKPIKEKESECMITGNHPSLNGLLECSEYIYMAMDTVKKSWRDLSAAESSSLSQDAIALVRRALEFHFNDLEGLLNPVRRALEKLDI